MRWRKRRARSLARESVQNLFELADKVYPSYPERAHRYVEIARNISMRTRVRIPRHLKRRFCSECHHFLVHGRNCRVRTRTAKVVITCLDCGNIMRIPFVQERKHRMRESHKRRPTEF